MDVVRYRCIISSPARKRLLDPAYPCRYLPNTQANLLCAYTSGLAYAHRIHAFTACSGRRTRINTSIREWLRKRHFHLVRRLSCRPGTTHRRNLFPRIITTCMLSDSDGLVRRHSLAGAAFRLFTFARLMGNGRASNQWDRYGGREILNGVDERRRVDACGAQCLRGRKSHRGKDVICSLTLPPCQRQPYGSLRKLSATILISGQIGGEMGMGGSGNIE
jgi:hypothetical protein